MRFLPTELEVKALRQYERERRPLDQLAEEDRFMLLFSKIERLTQRMNIITFVGNFSDNVGMLTPQLNAIIAASASVKSSPKLKRMLEVGVGVAQRRRGGWSVFRSGADLTRSSASPQIILALGNYMNSSKRGCVYGFKLQSLDLVGFSTQREPPLFSASRLKQNSPCFVLFSCWTPSPPTGRSRCCTTSRSSSRRSTPNWPTSTTNCTLWTKLQLVSSHILVCLYYVCNLF